MEAEGSEKKVQAEELQAEAPQSEHDQMSSDEVDHSCGTQDSVNPVHTCIRATYVPTPAERFEDTLTVIVRILTIILMVFTILVYAGMFMKKFCRLYLLFDSV